MKINGKKIGFIIFLWAIIMFSLPQLTESASKDSSSVYRVQMGISGEITVDPRFVEFSEQPDEDKLIISTESGVYIISDGSIERNIPTTNSVTSYAVIDDIDGDGVTDIILGTEDSVFPNIQAYSVGTGKRLWTFKSHMEMYRDDIGWYQHQPSILEIEMVEDIDKTRGNGIVIVSGYSVYLVDPTTGEEIWEYKNEDNVWDATIIEDINGNSTKEIVFGDQRGVIHVVDEGNGEEIWEVKNLNYENPVFPVVKTINERLAIILPEAAGSNIRALTVMDAATGEVIDKIALPVEKTQGQSIADCYFALDSQSRLGIVTSNLDTFVMSEDLNSILWSVPRVANSQFVVSKNKADDNFNGNVLVLFQAGSIDPNQTRYTPVRAMQMLDGEANETRWAYTVSDSLYNQTGGLRLVQLIGDLNDDGYQDVIAAISSDMYRRTNEIIKPEVLIISGKDGSELSRISLTPPAKIYGQVYQGDNRQHNSIVSLERFSDINEDGIDDIFVSTMQSVFILDGKNNKTIQFWTKEPWVYNLDQDSKYVFKPGLDMGDAIVLIPDDINGDKISDIVALGHERINLGLSKKSNEVISYYNNIVYTTESGGLDYHEAKLIEDIDSDGVKEILVRKWEDNAPLFIKLSLV